MAPRETFAARLARAAADWSATTPALAAAVGLIVVWAASRPLWESAEAWQLAISTLTTLLTFLMVFLIQRAQAKDARAIHLKLNELIAAASGASNRLVNVEALTEAELSVLHAHYGRMLTRAHAEGRLTEAMSVEDARRQATDVPGENSPGT